MINIERFPYLIRLCNSQKRKYNEKLFDALINPDGYYDILRKDMDDICEIAIRYNMVTDYKKGRLKGKGNIFQDSIRFELRLARLFERYFGKGCLNWDPPGSGQKLGEFLLKTTSPNIFIEVKTKEIQKRTILGLLDYGEGSIIGMLQKAYRKVPINTPFLVVLCNNPFYVDIDELQIKRSMLGLFDYKNDLLTIISPGFCTSEKHNKLSAIGHYYFHVDKENKSIKEYFNIYHNPYATIKIDRQIFKDKADNQFDVLTVS